MSKSAKPRSTNFRFETDRGVIRIEAFSLWDAEEKLRKHKITIFKLIDCTKEDLEFEVRHKLYGQSS